MAKRVFLEMREPAANSVTLQVCRRLQGSGYCTSMVLDAGKII